MVRCHSIIFHLNSKAITFLSAPGRRCPSKFNKFANLSSCPSCAWADPLNCTVGEPRKKYWGERYFPLIIQNIHRYFLYIAIVFLFLLAHDVWKALWFDGKFGIGVGTLVLLVNLLLLGSYTLSCHSLRHLVGGIFDVLSRRPIRKKLYDCVSCMNRRHMLFAWMSLFWVAFSDLYVRMCSMGIWTDWRIL